MIQPPKWQRERLQEDRQKAISVFRSQRLREPAGRYAQAIEEHKEIVEGLLQATANLRSVGQKALVRILTDDRYLSAFRYLSGPPVSEDDLRTLAEVKSLAPARLRANPETLAPIVNVVLKCLDKHRFPWVAKGRKPTEHERDAAILASACLMAYQRVQTERRKSGKDELEGAVEQCLLQSGFREQQRRLVNLLSDAPEPGMFCAETSCAGRRADFVVGLWDGRHLLVECKDSNSLVNSIKRLNNDTAAKASYWIRTFGERAVIPAAVIGGVYYLDSLEKAQAVGLTIFWGHDLQELTEWLNRVRESL